MTRLLAATLALGLAACAVNPATGLPGLGGSEGDPLATLGKFTLTDLQNADALAVAASDKVAHMCFVYLIPVLEAHIKQAGSPSLPVSGAFSGFMAARIAINKGKSLQAGGIPEDLNVACAPLIMDARMTILSLAARVGLGAVPGGNILGGIIPR